MKTAADFFEAEDNGHGWLELHCSKHEAQSQATTYRRLNDGDGFQYSAKQVTIRACGLIFKKWAVISHAVNA